MQIITIDFPNCFFARTVNTIHILTRQELVSANTCFSPTASFTIPSSLSEFIFTGSKLQTVEFNLTAISTTLISDPAETLRLVRLWLDQYLG